jgi:anti-sigma regulatory factor (Ser/Thr protein kinase)
MQARDQRRCVQAPGLGRSSQEPPVPDRYCQITLVPAPESASTARDFTIATLRGWHLEALIQDTVMVVSELVTNAIRHGTSCGGDSADDARVELSWLYEASRLICTVTDRSVKPPVMKPADLGAESGRGLQVVQALALAWGWAVLSTPGKAVWAAFQLPGTRG